MVSVSISANNDLMPIRSFAEADASFSSAEGSSWETRVTPDLRQVASHSMILDAMRLVRSSFQKATAVTVPSAMDLLSACHPGRLRTADAEAESLSTYSPTTVHPPSDSS